MLQKIKEMFRSDEFIPTSAVFPNIDRDRIAKELDLVESGKSRGKDNFPQSTASSPDSLEMKAIGRIEELRRRGLENYETNRRVYSERLNLAVSARMQVETEANDAKSRFTEEVTKWKAMMVTPRERVQEAFQWRAEFRKQNKLVRPAKEASSLVSIIGLALVMILLESAGNAYLFAQKNTLGLLGGLMAAFLVSLGNVALSTLFGMGSRYVNCAGFRNLFKKLLGLAFIVAWIVFMIGYNLAVAHFRDAVERSGEWRQAGIQAMQTLTSNPIGLYTMESYVLLVLGAFISIIAFLKGYNSSDPYPGYSKVTQGVLDAREEYVSHLENSIAALAAHRDEAVEALREANDEVQRNINDSVDALFGQKALYSNLQPFLEQCNLAANYLLTIYRDANVEIREEKPPAYFKKAFAFEKFENEVVTDAKRTTAEAQVQEVANMVNEAIASIFRVFQESVDAHYEIDELEDIHIERSRNRKVREGPSAPKGTLTVISDSTATAKDNA